MSTNQEFKSSSSKSNEMIDNFRKLCGLFTDANKEENRLNKDRQIALEKMELQRQIDNTLKRLDHEYVATFIENNGLFFSEAAEQIKKSGISSLKHKPPYVACFEYSDRFTNMSKFNADHKATGKVFDIISEMPLGEIRTAAINEWSVTGDNSRRGNPLGRCRIFERIFNDEKTDDEMFFRCDRADKEYYHYWDRVELRLHKKYSIFNSAKYAFDLISNQMSFSKNDLTK